MNQVERMQAHQDFCDDLNEVLGDLRVLIADKNRKYGDSALNPSRIFSKQDAIEQINVRIDDKLSRKVSDQTDEDEDIDLDLLGYLILKRIAVKRRNASNDAQAKHQPSRIELQHDFDPT